jgi:carbamoyltransferase
LSVVLGLNAYHGDSSACLLRDGKLVAAAEEERFRRIKHWAGFPAESIKYCLAEAGVALEDVSHVAINQNSRANLLRKLSYAVAGRPTIGLLLDKLRNRRKRVGLEEEFGRAFGRPWRGPVHRVEHHLAHLGSTFLVSPFESAVAVSVDGFGDFASAAWGLGRASEVEVDDRVYFPHSLGAFYQAMTQFLGFPHYGDEYKVMGLAPYGEPNYLPEMRRIVRVLDDGGFELDLTYFRHHRGRIDYMWKGGAPVFSLLYSDALLGLLGPARAPDEPLAQRHRDLARSAQAMYEEAFFNLLNRLYQRYGVDALCLSGGCAMNSVANGKVYRQTPFKRLYVQSAAGDAGGAIGAALVAWHSIAKHNARPRFLMDHAYWGPGFANGELGALLRELAGELREQACSVLEIGDEGELCGAAAKAIAAGGVVGWFQGRMEWGPRALGNRSIVCDPRKADMKDVLNRKIKRRESFRPFAPSILREAVADWFETDDDVPFMTQVYQIRPEKRPVIPAVTHVDGSGRLQTVHRDTNERYYRLIEAFRELTGVPLVLNTSFNENEPVVCKPAEALDCFLRTKMDALVLGNWMIQRAAAS